MSLLFKVLGNMLMCIGILMILLPVAATALGVLGVNDTLGTYVDHLSDINMSNSILQPNVTYATYNQDLQPYVGQASSIGQLVNNIERTGSSVQSTIDDLQLFDYYTHELRAISLFAIGFTLAVIGFIFTKAK
jgi:hypothetical protein